MKRRIVATALATAVMGVAATSYTVSATESPEHGTDPAAAQQAVVPLEDMTIRPGGVDTVDIGMSQTEALATGYFNADVKDVCGDYVYPLQWKDEYATALDVQSKADGSVASIAIRDRGPETASGLEVGDTFETVQEALGGAEPTEAGYAQTGLFVQEGDRWIGFLFDAAPDEVQADEPVLLIEVTKGAAPGLMRDGC